MKWLVNVILGINQESKKEIVDEYKDQMHEIAQEQAQLIVDPVQIKQMERELSHQGLRPPESKRDACEINFTVNTEGKIHINLDFGDTELNLADSLGRLLFHIHCGDLAKECRRILSTIQQQQPQSRIFINKVVKTWDKAMGNSEPIIKPSEVFTMPEKDKK